MAAPPVATTLEAAIAGGNLDASTALLLTQLVDQLNLQRNQIYTLHEENITLQASNVALQTQNGTFALRIFNMEAAASLGGSSSVTSSPPSPLPITFLGNVGIGPAILSSSTDLHTDWPSHKGTLAMRNKNGDQVQFRNAFIVSEEEVIRKLFPKTSGRKSDPPKFGNAFKTSDQYIQLVVDYVAYLKSGGIPNIGLLLGPHLQLFAKSVGVTEAEIVSLSSCEFVAVVLYNKWELKHWDGELVNIKLEYYGPGTLLDTVLNYIIKLDIALHGRPYNEFEFRSHILSNISTSYLKWVDELVGLADYDKIYDRLEERAREACQSFQRDGLQLPMSQKAGAKSTGKASVNAITAVPDNTFKPPEDRVCEVCKLPYKKQIKEGFQTHGFPVLVDRQTKIVTYLCPLANAENEATKIVVEKLKKQKGK